MTKEIMTNEIMGLTREDLDALPEQYIIKLMEILVTAENDTIEDLSIPKIGPSMINIYPLFVVMYSVLVLAGTIMNCGMIYHITRHKLYRDPTFAYIINIAVSDLIKCVFVLPITLAVLLIENWIFGSFMCYFLPILQDIPNHISMMTYLLIAVDRYKLLSEPEIPRIPAFVCAIGSWFCAVCIVLPHPIYTTYYDLERYNNEHLSGVGICFTNVSDNIEQYMRGLFLLTYIVPLAITTYIYVKSSRELQAEEGPFRVATCEERSMDFNSRYGSAISNEIPSIRSGERQSDSARTSTVVGLAGNSRTNDLYEVELNVVNEKRTQKYLISMTFVFAVLYCPLMVLKLAKLSVVETYENSGLLDITFTLFIWLAFLSTVTTPTFYIAWRMSRSTKERLRSNLFFWNRRLSRQWESGTEMTNDQLAGNIAVASNVGPSENGQTGSFVSESIGDSRGSRGSPRWREVLA